MEEEIDLTQLIATLWKGKYIIIAVTLAAIIIALVASTVFVTPQYQATAYIDLVDYQDDDKIDDDRIEDDKIEEFMRRPDRETLIKEALADLTAEPRALARSINMQDSEQYQGFFEVVATSPEPELAAAAANEVSLFLLRWSSQHDLDQLLLKKESQEQALEFFDDQLKAATGRSFSLDKASDDLSSGYLESSLRLLAEELILKKEALEDELKDFDQYIIATFGQISQSDLEEAMTDKQLINPAYETMMVKRGRLLSDLFEIEQALNLLKTGRLPNIDVAEGTVFETVVNTRDQLRSDLLDSILKINQAEYTLEHLNEERYLYQAEVPGSPFNLRWQLNTAVAGVLGLMVSVFLVFMIPFIKTLRENLKE